MKIEKKRRVVITGLGTVNPTGNTVAESWAAVKAGRCAVGPITAFDTTDFKVKLAAEVKDFDPAERIDRREARKMARFTQFAVAAADEAIAVVREQQPHGFRLHQLIHAGKRALHLAVHNAVVVGLGLCTVEFVVPALLHEDLGLFVDGGAEHRVQVDLHQVVEIPAVAAAHGVHRLVRVGHGIEECIQ